MNWKPGDRAVILWAGDPNRIGLRVTVLSELRLCRNHRQYGCAYVHDVDIPPSSNVPSKYASYLPEHLGPIPPDEYDGNEAAQWSDCVWQPKELVTL